MKVNTHALPLVCCHKRAAWSQLSHASAGGTGRYTHLIPFHSSILRYLQGEGCGAACSRI